jgi:hypothetical protein
MMLRVAERGVESGNCLREGCGRLDVAYLLGEAPSLKPKLSDGEWMRLVWAKALAQAVSETGLDVFPEVCPWTMEQVLDDSFMPE